MVNGRVMRLHLIGIVALLCGNLFTVYGAKPDPEREAAYQAITNSFEAENWETTLLLIDRFQSQYVRSDREASLLMLSAESNLKLRRLERADALAAKVILQFPEMNLAGRARLTLGESALLAGDWERAELNLAWVVSFSNDLVAVRLARARLDELRAYLMAEEKVTQTTPVGDQPKVALILPTTGAMANEADNFLKGFLYSWKKSTLPEPYLFDSENDPVKAVRLFGEIARVYNPWIVIGGLFAWDATGLAAYSQSVQIPFLTTACGDDGLAAVSSYAVQGRSDYGGLGAALGRFAALNMGLRNLAILHVNNVSGRRMAKEFREQAELNGGQIQGEAAFYPGTIDYSNSLLQLKNTIIRHNYDDSLNSEYLTQGRLVLNGAVYVPRGKDIARIETLNIDRDLVTRAGRLSGQFLDSLWSSERRTRRWATDSADDFDSAAIELPSLEGLFVAIEPGTIEMIAPQLTRYRLNRQIFGDENWDDRDALRKVQRYVNGMVFASPLAAADDSALITLTGAMAGQGDKSVSRYHFAGERAARIVQEAALRSKSRESFRDALTTLNGVSTMSGNVTLLREERVDRSQGLIMFKDGSFVRVGGK